MKNYREQLLETLENDIIKAERKIKEETYRLDLLKIERNETLKELSENQEGGAVIYFEGFEGFEGL